MDGIKDGDVKTYFYALFDDRSGKFGLMNADGTPKPAGTAIHNLTTLLADTGATASTFATGTLSYTLGWHDRQRQRDSDAEVGWQLLGIAVERERCRPQRHPHSDRGRTDPRVRSTDRHSGGVNRVSRTKTVSVSDHPVLVEIQSLIDIPPGFLLTVGPGQQYATIAAAVAAARAGDTIQVQAGTYTNDFVTAFKSITLQAVGGVVKMVATVAPPNGKAIIDEGGSGVNVTINGFEISGARLWTGMAQPSGMRAATLR